MIRREPGEHVLLHVVARPMSAFVRIAPITEPGAAAAEVYLPDGE